MAVANALGQRGSKCVTAAPWKSPMMAWSTVCYDYFRVADDRCSINNTSAWWLLVCGPGKQQQIPIRIFDDEILGAPRLLFQCLAKGNPSGLKFKKQ